MDDILLEPMFPGLTLNSASKESLVALTLTDVLTIDTGTILATDLISNDNPNDLKLGSDNKLLSQPTDTDFLAYYILAKG